MTARPASTTGSTISGTVVGDTIIWDGSNWIVSSPGTAAPVSGGHVVGDRVWNSIPEAGGNAGWVCTTAGTPGTWKPYGVIGV